MLMVMLNSFIIDMAGYGGGGEGSGVEQHVPSPGQGCSEYSFTRRKKKWSMTKLLLSNLGVSIERRQEIQRW